jgi:NTP pyrophosphatase (non-canonical NTP hydrolase)
MLDLKISKLMQMQKDLWEVHKDSWSPLTKEYARNSMLWLVEEFGEAIAIVKKKGEDQIMNNPQVREHFIEEMNDVLMYFMDTLIRFGVSPQELSESFVKKNQYNIERTYNRE